MKMTSIFEADVRRLFSGWRIWWLGVRPPIAFISTCDMIFLAAESSTGDAFELFTHAGNSWNVQSSSATVDCNGMLHRAPAPATMIFCEESSGPEYTPIMVREGGSHPQEVIWESAWPLESQESGKRRHIHPECTRSALSQLQMIDLV
jgi:hypothetical protein